MQTVKNTHFHTSSIRRVWVNYICSDFLMQVKCLSPGAPVKKGNALLRSYLNAKSGTTYNAVPLLPSDLPPGERTGCGLDDRPRKGRMRGKEIIGVFVCLASSDCLYITGIPRCFPEQTVLFLKTNCE